jgi:hypothetical protein
MPQALRSRLVVLTALTVLVTVSSPALAASRANATAPTSFGAPAGDVIGRFRAWLEQLVKPDWGCTMDPSGRCRNAVTPSWGCGMDPNGGACPPASAPSAAAKATPRG